MPAVRFPSLEVRTRAFQAGNDGFKVYAPLRSVLDVVHRTTAPRRSYCGYRIVAVKRTQFALQTCGSAYGAQDVRGTSVLRRPKRSVDRFPLVKLWMGMPSGEGSGL